MSALLLLSGLALAQEAPPIINGESATEEDYPMAGAMLMDGVLNLGAFGTYDLRLLVCSSTLIAPDVVMLAAHCLDDTAFTFGLGTIDDKDVRWTRTADLSVGWDGSATPEWPEDAVAAWDWAVHEDFDLFSLQTGLALNYDIALLFLDTPIYDVPLGYLIRADEADQVVEDASVDVVGWGQQTATNIWEAPPEGTYGIKMMGTSHIAQVADYEIQIGEEESDVRKCHGDSGGPTFLSVESDYKEPLRVIGVTSHSYDQTDCFTTGGVDTRVDYYLDWIEQQMTSRCDSGDRAWCVVPGILEPGYIPEEPSEETGDTADTGMGGGDTDVPGGDDTDTTGGDDTDVPGGDTDTTSGDDGGGADTNGGAADTGGETSEGKGCACSAGGSSGAAGAFWALGLLGLAARRRRSPRA